MQSCQEKNREQARNIVMSLSMSTRARSLNTMYSSGLLVLKEYSKNNKGINKGNESDQKYRTTSSLDMSKQGQSLKPAEEMAEGRCEMGR